MIWPLERILAGTTSLSQSWPGSNGNEGVLQTPQISRTGTSPSDAVFCHIQDTSFFKRWRSYSLTGDTISVFLALPIVGHEQKPGLTCTLWQISSWYILFQAKKLKILSEYFITPRIHILYLDPNWSFISGFCNFIFFNFNFKLGEPRTKILKKLLATETTVALEPCAT